MELSVCAEYHISRSKFLRWSLEDRSAAVAFYVEKASHCQMCGTAPWEWDPKQGGDMRAYEPVEQVCIGCKLKADMQNLDPTTNKSGVTIELNRRDTLESELRRKRENEMRTEEAEEKLAAKQAERAARQAKIDARKVKPAHDVVR